MRTRSVLLATLLLVLGITPFAIAANGDPMIAGGRTTFTDITRVLGSFGRSGVPLYLLYPAGTAGAPAVLPQILSERVVLEATEKL